MSAVLKLAESPKALVVTLLATLVVLAGGTWFMLVSPKHTKATSLSSEIQSAQTQLDLRKHVVQKHKETALDGVRLRRAMPTAVAMPQIVIELSRLADLEHVSIESINPTAATPYAGFETIPISLTVTGKYAEVQGFLRELRTQVRVSPTGRVFATGRLFDVESVALSQTTPAPRITAALKLDAFVYLIIPAAVAAAPATTAAATSG